MAVMGKDCLAAASRYDRRCLDTGLTKNKNITLQRLLMLVYGLRKKAKYDANSLKPIKFYFSCIELYKYRHLHSLNHNFPALVRINTDMNTD